MSILLTPWVLIGLTLILQTTVLQHLSLAGVRPDLFLICALYLGLFRESGGKYGFLVGLLQDFSGGRFLGANALSKGLLGLLSEGIRRQFLNLPYFVLLIFFFFWRAFSTASCYGFWANTCCF
ncbi:MAG: rod shape-determining protein MreD [Candidatus Binatia bacterium]